MRAVSSVIVSMGLIAIGNGLLFALVPIKLAAAGYDPWVAGAAVTAMAAGGFIGCVVTGSLIRRVGHARVFATFGAIVALTVLPFAVGIYPLVWIAARAVYGIAITGLFIVCQSWLNDACENAWRARVIAMFYATYVIGIGAGAYLLRHVSLDGADAALLAIAFSCLSILPVSLTRLRTPAPPESTRVALRAVWRISPVGLVGMFAVGGLTMTVQGFAPIYAAASGFAKDEVALLIFLMQFGMLGVQYPLGALSDRIDRRAVLLIACAIVVACAAGATRLDGAALAVLVLVFAIWAGATESVFSVANAHANDRASPAEYVSVSSTLLVAWSTSGLLVPGLTTVLTSTLGPEAFMHVVIVIAGAFAAFVAFRMTRRSAVDEQDQAPYQPISAQAPYSAELLPPADATSTEETA